MKSFGWRQAILYATQVASILLVAGSVPWAQETRQIKTSVPPGYPELARRMNLRGIARVQLTVTPEGTVKDVKELGGNPVLLEALVRAAKKWKYEPANRESIVEVKFDFAP
jgi:TonB family protein